MYPEYFIWETGMEYLLLALVIITLLYIIIIFNALVAKKNRIENGFAQIQVQLKRRYDLIPSLVETVKAAMNYEKETLETVIQARNSAQRTLEKKETSIQDISEKEQQLVQNLNRVQLLIEAYPELKANESVLLLMEELGSTENRIAFARQAYNDFVYSFNAYRQSFPQNIFAISFGFKENGTLLQFDDSKLIQKMPQAIL